MIKLLENDQLHSFVDGQWLANSNKLTVINPFNHEKIANVSDASMDQVLLAIDAAKKAQPAWQQQTAQYRSRVLKKWFELVIEYQDQLAELMTLEQGKPLFESKGEISYGASFIEWFAEEAKRINGDVIAPANSDKRLMVIKQPVGVVAAITPWNFPSSMITRKAAPALAAGCSFIIKPASQTPLSALALARLAQMAGVPNGVFNVVISTQANKVGELLTSHPDIRKFSFTGSTKVGKKLLAQCAGTVKNVSMELGGNAPFIVFDDADIDAAVEGALLSKYRNAGQTCVCSNRIFVQEDCYQQFLDKFSKAVADFQLGDGLNETTQIGPLISTEAMQQIEQLVESAVEQGANCIVGGKLSSLGKNIYQPTILTNVTNDMAIAQQEIFGPVAPIIKFKTEQQVIEQANDTEYGLAAYFYSRDIGRIWRVAESLEFGMVGINEGIISNASAPFGGVKSSGIGREGSKYGIDEYIETKYLCMGGIS